LSFKKPTADVKRQRAVSIMKKKYPDFNIEFDTLVEGRNKGRGITLTSMLPTMSQYEIVRGEYVEHPTPKFFMSYVIRKGNYKDRKGRKRKWDVRCCKFNNGKDFQLRVGVFNTQKEARAKVVEHWQRRQEEWIQAVIRISNYV